MEKALWQKPVFFASNRVRRVYTGGKLLGEFIGSPCGDDFFPEEWIASSVEAINPGSTVPAEGISRLETDGQLFSELLQEDPVHFLGDRNDVGVLVKFLDSAIRLPMQVHPTRDFSRRYFSSSYGKAEAWLVLATRPDACLYFGFRERISREQFEKAVLASETDRDSLPRLVNRISVQPGDVFFVPAGIIHAIGQGCLILEAQEPTDFTIQPEAWCGDCHLSPEEMYLGLNPTDALSCFDLDKFGPDVIAAGKKEPSLLFEEPGMRCESLIGPADTSCFSIRRYVLQHGRAQLDQPAGIYIVTQGSGCLHGEGYTRNIRQGEYFFLPAAAAGSYEVEGTLQLVCCCGAS